MNFFVDKIQKFFESIARYFTNSGYAFSWLFIIFMGVFALTTLIVIISSIFSYEFMLIRAIEKINKFLTKNPRINDDNLIPFNNKMKERSIPKILRRQWQQFMLYREHEASYYMSFQHCVENPLKNSNYRQQISIYRVFSYVLAFLSILLGIFCSNHTSFIDILQDVLIIPVFIIVLFSIISMILNLIHNATTGDLYQNYQYFEINIDKATLTLPEYVDYEVLFTQDEIKHGIPVLFEYIQKRAIEEQKELERARIKNVEHEKFNFEQSGLDASLVLERSMQEAENYIATRKKFMQDIEQVNNEINAIENQYKENVKENQRLMQTSKESVDGLKKQLEQATSSIEINYIKKQMKDEINRQQIAERDFDALTDKHNKEVKALQSEVERLQTEIEDAKSALESNMISEFSTYSTKIYNKVEEAVQENEKVVIDDYKKQINDLEEKLALKDEELDNVYTQYQAQLAQLEEKSKQFDSILKEKDDMISQAQDQLEMSKSGRSKKVKHFTDVEDVKPQENYDPVYESVSYSEPEQPSYQPEENYQEPVDEKVVEQQEPEFNYNDNRLDDNHLVEQEETFDYSSNEEFNYSDDQDSSYSYQDTSYDYSNSSEPSFDYTSESEPVVNQEVETEQPSFNYFDDEQPSFNYMDEDVFGDNSSSSEPVSETAEETPSFSYLDNEQDTNTENASEEDDNDEDEGIVIKPEGNEFDYLDLESETDVDNEKADEEEQQANEDSNLDTLFDSWLSEDEEESEKVEEDVYGFTDDESEESEDEDLTYEEDEESDFEDEEVEEVEEDVYGFSDDESEESEDEDLTYEEDEDEEVEEVEEEIEEDDTEAEEDEVEEVVVPVRRVGRPRKVVEATEEKPKRRVGRPRKVVESEPVVKRKAGRPKKVVEAVEEAPKRRVGRPKKVEAVKPVKRVGRPRKDSDESPAKRSVGRPKKANPVGRPKTKKSVGRPKKEVKKVKQVGRPKKEVTASSRPVGRPKKARPVGRPRKARPVGRPRKTTKESPRQAKISEIDKQLNALNKQIARESSNIAKTQKQLANVKLTKSKK